MLELLCNHKEVEDPAVASRRLRCNNLASDQLEPTNVCEFLRCAAPAPRQQLRAADLREHEGDRFKKLKVAGSNDPDSRRQIARSSMETTWANGPDASDAKSRRLKAQDPICQN